MEALARGYLVSYTTLDDLVRGLRQADALGKLNNKLAQLQRPHVLVIDEAGYLPLDRADANRIFQVVNRRYTRASTIITSNKTVGEWADTFGDEALAAAILDRLLHDAEVLAINGPSYRPKRAASTLSNAPPTTGRRPKPRPPRRSQPGPTNRHFSMAINRHFSVRLDSSAHPSPHHALGPIAPGLLAIEPQDGIARS